MFKQFSYVFLLLVAATSTSANTLVADSYVVSVLTADNPPLCGGVLINKDTVLTSAQCLASYDANQLVVAINNGAQIIKIISHKFKSDYDFVTMENDVALLKLAQPVEAPYAKLASKQPKTGASGVVFNSDKVPVSIVNYQECASGKHVYNEEEIFSTMLCGLVKDEKACVGRAGSPLVADNQLVGLVSWGGCGSNGKPAVFTNIPSIMPWITQTAQKL